MIDNGSTDGTIQFLKSLPKTKVIINKVNRGFSGGCNQGFNVAKGEFLVLLNNDTVVTKDWLYKLLECLNNNSDAGIVGPRSNYIVPQQTVPSVPYKQIEEMHQFALNWSKEHDQESYEVDYLSGLCMVFRKSLIDAIGGMDEQFNPGYYEDTDFCMRARIYEKKLLVANDVFIHHYGSSSFKTDKKLQLKTIHENKGKFFRKWNMNHLDEINHMIEREKPFKRGKALCSFLDH